MAEAAAAADLDALAEVERKYLGKRSELFEVREAIKTAPPDERKAIGRALADAQAAIRLAIDERQARSQPRARVPTPVPRSISPSAAAATGAVTSIS